MKHHDIYIVSRIYIVCFLHLKTHSDCITCYIINFTQSLASLELADPTTADGTHIIFFFVAGTSLSLTRVLIAGILKLGVGFSVEFDLIEPHALSILQ